jgi:hypothetical protein|eukprot:COSAG01_NODE_2008_length_8659_cov_5.172664_2_plen_130_part_00
MEVEPACDTCNTGVTSRQSGTLDQAELTSLVVGTIGFLKDKFKAEQTTKGELDKQLKEAKKDPLMGGTRDSAPRLNVPLLYRVAFPVQWLWQRWHGRVAQERRRCPVQGTMRWHGQDHGGDARQHGNGL